MGLSEYAGRTPDGCEQEAVIDRVSRHHRWDIDGGAKAECANCGTSLPLRERHLLVRLSGRPAARADDSRHLCDERCLREWVGET